MFAEAVGGEAGGDIEARFAAGDDAQDARSADGPGALRHDVGGQILAAEAFADEQPDGDGGVEVTAGDVTDGEGHGENREAKGQTHSQ